MIFFLLLIVLGAIVLFKSGPKLSDLDEKETWGRPGRHAITGLAAVLLIVIGLVGVIYHLLR